MTKTNHNSTLNSIQNQQVSDSPQDHSPESSIKYHSNKHQIPSGILEYELEHCLMNYALSLSVDYESMFSMFIGNVSIAIGGNKRLIIDSKWSEKACLWIALIGVSGTGKTQILNYSGFEELSSFQKKKHDDYRNDLERFRQWERLPKSDRERQPMPDEAIFHRIYEQHLTLEMLAKIHEENPLGIGIINDELLGFFNGLGQYKKGGNDIQKVLEYWNCKSSSNPASGQDRFIPDVYVPICGGMQPAFLNELINQKSNDNGLASRFIFTFLEQGKPLHQEERQQLLNSISEEESTCFRKVFTDLLNVRDSSKEYRLSKDASTILGDYVFKLECKSREQEEASPYMKLRSYAYRITLLLHCIKSCNNNEISFETAQHGIALTEYFRINTDKAHSHVSMTDEERKRDKVITKIKSLGGMAKPEVLKSSLQKTFGGKSNMTPFLDKLVKDGTLKKETQGREIFFILENGNEVTK